MIENEPLTGGLATAFVFATLGASGFVCALTGAGAAFLAHKIPMSSVPTP